MSTSKKLVPAFTAFLAAFIVPAAAFAADGDSNKFDVGSYAAIGAGLAMGLAVLGGALGQGRAAAAALEGVARNPGASGKILTPMILGLALIESLVLIAFVVALWLRGIAQATVGGG
jgi:F-type H+-transporting ATPase subunit c